MKIKLNLAALLLCACMLLITACGANGQGKTDTSNAKQNAPANANAANNAASSNKNANIKFATNTQGSAWYVYGATMAELLRPVLKDSSIDVLPYSGGVGNAKMLQDKKADIALSFSITSKWAYEGNVAYSAKQENLRGLVGALDKYYIGIVASKSFVDKYGVKSVKDIADKKIPARIYTNNKGSLAEFSTRQVLEAYGLDYEAVKKLGGKVELTSNDVIKNSFQNGEADLHILVMPKGHPTISEIVVHTPIVFLGMEQEIVGKFQKLGYSSAMFPKGQYKGQDNDVQTVGFSTMILTTANLSDDLAYNITKAVNENKDKLVNAHDALKDFEPSKAWAAESLNVPLHPGAQKYYKEKGLIK